MVWNRTFILTYWDMSSGKCKNRYVKVIENGFLFDYKDALELKAIPDCALGRYCIEHVMMQGRKRPIMIEQVINWPRYDGTN